MTDTPAPPPTSQWTVIWTNNDVPFFFLDGQGQHIEDVLDALNGGPDVEALRSVEPTAEWRELLSAAKHQCDIGPWRTTTRLHEAVRQVSAALVREQTGHQTVIEEHGRYRKATCTCGWAAPLRDAWLSANGDAEEHVREQTEGTTDG